MKWLLLKLRAKSRSRRLVWCPIFKKASHRNPRLRDIANSVATDLAIDVAGRGGAGAYQGCAQVQCGTSAVGCRLSAVGNRQSAVVSEGGGDGYLPEGHRTRHQGPGTTRFGRTTNPSSSVPFVRSFVRSGCSLRVLASRLLFSSPFLSFFTSPPPPRVRSAPRHSTSTISISLYRPRGE